MVFELMGTRQDTGKAVKARVEASTRERAVERLRKQGIIVAAQPAATGTTKAGAPPHKSPDAQKQGSGHSLSAVAVSPMLERHTDRFKVAGTADRAGQNLPPQPLRSERETVTAEAIAEPAISGSSFVSSSLAANPRFKLLVGAGALAALLMVGNLWFVWLGNSSTAGVTNAMPSAADSSSAAVPQEESAEAKQWRMNQATAAAYNELVRVDNQVYGQIKHYGTEFASALKRHYSAVSLTDVDRELHAWVLDVVAECDALIEDEQQRENKLYQISAGSSDRAQNAAIQGAEWGSNVAAKQGRPTKDQMGTGLVTGAAGAVLSTLDTELRKQSINEEYNRRLNRRGRTLQSLQNQRGELRERLVARYGWNPS